VRAALLASALALALVTGEAAAQTLGPLSGEPGWSDFWQPCRAIHCLLLAQGISPGTSYHPIVQSVQRRGYAVLLPLLARVVDEPGWGDDPPAMATAATQHVEGLLRGGRGLYAPAEARAVWERIEAAAAEGQRREAARDDVEPWRLRLVDLLTNADATGRWRQFGEWPRGREPECQLGARY
jgi:hypothetical protein